MKLNMTREMCVMEHAILMVPIGHLLNQLNLSKFPKKVNEWLVTKSNTKTSNSLKMYYGYPQSNHFMKYVSVYFSSIALFLYSFGFLFLFIHFYYHYFIFEEMRNAIYTFILIVLLLLLCILSFCILFQKVIYMKCENDFGFSQELPCIVSNYSSFLLKYKSIYLQYSSI